MFAKLSLFLFLVIGSALAYDDEYEGTTYDVVGTSRFSRSILRNATTGKSCTTEGNMCESCSKVSYCLSLPPDNDWLKEPLYDCPAGQTCSDDIRNCSSSPNPKCDTNVLGYTFTCYQIGIFPDAFDCFKYHLCLPSAANASKVDPKSVPLKCSNGYAFDPLTSMCRLKTVDGTCTPAAPACTSIGKAGAIKRNPAMYYLCLPVKGVPFPQMFMCPPDQIHNGVKCVLNDPPVLGSDNMCLATGLFPEPNSCKAYWNCVEKRTPTRYTCPFGNRFDFQQRKCVEFQC